MTSQAIRGAGLAATLLLALAAPAWLLRDATPRPAPATAPRLRPLLPLAAPPLDRALARPLFAPAPAPLVSEDEGASTGPELLGVVGRLGQDAVAMVRGSDGGTRTLAIGEASDGWRLESIARDAVLFTRGAERRRIELPAQ